MNKIKNIEVSHLYWPIAFTFLLTSLLSLVDSIMISRYDIELVALVAVVAQLSTLFGPMYFGVFSAVNIYTIQFHTTHNAEKLQKIFTSGLIIALPLSLLHFGIMIFAGEQFIGFFIKDNPQAVATAYNYMLVTSLTAFLIPLNMLFLYQNRAIKKPKVGLYVSLISSIINIILNYLLIFGHFGFPELGIIGAGIATVIARFISLLLYIAIAFYQKVEFLPHHSLRKSFDKKLTKEITTKALPLVLTEFAFGLARVIYFKIYALTSIAGLTAYQISVTIMFVYNSFVMATVNVVSIYVGRALTRTKKEVSYTLRKMFKFMGFVAFSLIIMMLLTSPILINFYTDEQNLQLVVYQLTLINAVYLALRVFASSLIAIIKSGGKTNRIIFIDGGPSYLVGIPLTLLTYYFISDSIVVLRFIVIIEMVVRIVVGLFFIKRSDWRINLTKE